MPGESRLHHFQIQIVSVFIKNGSHPTIVGVYGFDLNSHRFFESEIGKSSFRICSKLLTAFGGIDAVKSEGEATFRRRSASTSLRVMGAYAFWR